MAKLTEDMKRMVAHLHLCYVATVTPDGKPNLSPKGSLKVWDDEHLVFADIASPVTVRNLEANPHIEINMVDPFLRRGYRFKGQGLVLRSGPEFSSCAEEMWTREGPQYPVNGVVKVHIETVSPVLSPAYTFNDNVREEQLKEVWLERYGVREGIPVIEKI